MEQTAQRQVRIIPATKNVNAPLKGAQKHQRVAAYCRVSTDSEEQITSYEAQKAYYTQKIEENPDWELAGIFADKGLSGTSMKKRENFNKMIAACKKGKIDTILTKSLSRFARNTVDCLETVRMLKANGIGVIFEKENINTLTESSEFLITLFSGFAQAESESLSKNIIWGKEESKKAGKVPFQYKKLLGYRKGPDGKPEIDPQEAETVRRIYRRYLDGCSLSQIQQELEADRVPTAQAIQRWSYQVIRNILTNERYIGDAMLGKTFTTDCISKRVKKNNGERGQSYVRNNHPAIIPREMFYRVQEEMARRSSKRKVMQKTGKTELGKYSAKYALSELLVCGECGTPYKRVTWARNGKKRIVWRCISRLEFGTKYCHNSPTLDEEKLHQAIQEAINEFAQAGTEVKEDTGDNAAHQQLCDRLACGDAVEDHHQAGRDHGSQRTADGLYRSGEILGIAAALHLRIHQAADSRRCSGSGAGKGGEDGGRHDGDNAQTAADTPQQHRGHIHKTLGDAALAHHLTGDDKGGDCQKTEVVGAGKNALCQQHQRHSVHRQQSGNAGQ